MTTKIVMRKGDKLIYKYATSKEHKVEVVAHFITKGYKMEYFEEMG